MFGQNSTNNVFGQSSGFGTNTSAFGLNQTQQQQPQQTSLFGQPQQSTSLFGTTQPAANTSFFGGATPGNAQTSAFGMQQPQQTNTFGTSNSLFGASNTLTQPNNNNTSLFGNNNNTTSAFGMNNTASSFGVMQAQAPNGTTVKYQPQSSTDSMVKNGQTVTISIKLHCITCMREYETKSIDELRLEDYAANRKAPTNPGMGASTSAGLFGNTMNTGTNTLFGQPSASNTFGANTSTSLFGGQQNKPAGFGSMAPATSTTNSLFGGSTLNANKPTGFGFGTSNATTTFGQPAAQPTNSLFGAASQPQTTSLFGSTPAQTNTSIFGQTPQPTANTSLFGANQAQAKPLFGSTTFGQPTSTGGGLFGSNTTTGTTFGVSTSQPSLFGATNPVSTTNTTFGAAKPMFGGFGTTPATGFGTNTSSSGLFGATNTATTGFGTQNTAGGTGLFGSTAPSTFGAGTTSTFGAPAAGTSGFSFGNTNTSFGAPAANLTSGTTGFGGFGTGNTSFGANNTSFGGGSGLFGNTGATNTLGGGVQQQPQVSSLNNSLNTQQILTRLETMPYGAQTQLPVDSSFQTSSVKTTFTTNPKTLNRYKIDAKAHNGSFKVQRVPTSMKPSNLLFDGLEDNSFKSPKSAADLFSPKPSVKKLVLNKHSDESSINFKSLFGPKVQQFSSPSIELSTPKMESTRIVNGASLEQTSPKQCDSSLLNDTIAEMNKLEKQTAQAQHSPEQQNKSSASDEQNVTFNGSLEYSFGGPAGDLSYIDETDQKQRPVPNCGVILNRAEYFTIPSLEECDESYDPETDSCIVSSFTVARTGYGSIFWKGPLDIKGLNLDEIVHIRRKEVIVYPDDEVKPPHGQGLNRPAQVTLDQVWPINKVTRTFIKDPEKLQKYSEHLEAATHRLDATFKEYRAETGSWVFTVKHFSKYGLEDDDDVDMDTVAVKENDGKNVKAFNSETFASKMNQRTKDVTNELLKKSVLCEKQLYTAAGDDLMQTEVVENGDFQKKDLEIVRKQNVLFDDENDDKEDAAGCVNIAKKVKNSNFIKSSNARVVANPIASASFMLMKPTHVKKRVLRISSEFQPLRSNAYSMHCAPCTRVQFINGSNQFCFVQDKTVFVLNYNASDIQTDQNIETIKDHFAKEIVVKSELSSILNQRKSAQFSLSSGLTSSMAELVETLYGELSEKLPYARYQERLQRIKNWLFTFNKKLDVPMSNSGKRILHFLTTNELEFAVTEAEISNNHRLGFLVACCTDKSNALKNLKQLDFWKRQGYDTRIDLDLLKVYVLFAGRLNWVISSGQSISVLAGLHWTQQLALILLFADDQIAEGDLFDANPLKNAISKMSLKPKDVEFHLLAQSSPWTVLSSADLFLDIRSWFLHETLVSFNVITPDWRTSSSDFIHLFMASQMTDLRWALFFVMHVQNDFLRLQCTRDLVFRNAEQLFDASVELFLGDNFNIDPRLMAESKLFWAKTFNNTLLKSELMIELGNYVEAHRLVVAEILPELVINQKNDDLQTQIDKLVPFQDKLSNVWFTSGAGVYEVYLKLCQFNDKSNREEMLQLLDIFSNNTLKFTTQRHFLCKSIMTTVANIVKHSICEELAAVEPCSNLFDTQFITLIKTRMAMHRAHLPLNSFRA